MALRLMQIFVSETSDEELDSLMEDLDLIGRWQDQTVDGRMVLNAVVEAEQTEPVMDRLEEAFGDDGDVRVVLYAIEAVLPRPDPEKEPSSTETGQQRHGKNGNSARVCREELYEDVSETLGFDRVFAAMAFLSAVVAAVGLLRDDVAVIIGAMVIAPLLGPNVALALATTLGDAKLLRRALVTNVCGLAIVLLTSVAIGAVFTATPHAKSIADRTQVNWVDLILALSAGGAGTFAFTRGLSGAVIGVMVAVALVPPLVAAGMLLGGGYWYSSLGAAWLTATNLICINLAGVGTFLVQGVRPRTWYEEKLAKRHVIAAIVIWGVLLAALIAILALRPDQ